MNLIQYISISAALVFTYACSTSVSNTNQVAQAGLTPPQNVTVKPHKYGGWYCPDNLNGFPAVNPSQWDKVPVINGRMPSKDETQTEQSLIYVDPEQYPNARAMDVHLPLLATYYCKQSRRKETIIVIQAFTIGSDSIVGFRFLNGGNGSARWNEVKIVEEEKSIATPQKFVSYEVEIKAGQDSVWAVITDKGYAQLFESCFPSNGYYTPNWFMTTNVNYFYKGTKNQTSAYAGLLFGAFYIQNDYEDYSEKILLLEHEETGETTMKMVCGPFDDNYEAQQKIVRSWAKRVKDLVEGGC